MSGGCLLGEIPSVSSQFPFSKAYALKQELHRLKVFHDYEDRFLDLFKDPG